MMASMALALALWPLALSLPMMAAVLVPWALGCFSSNSAQQARLGAVAPALAPALMALNTSAMYLGQAVGAGSGGVLLAHSGFAWLNVAALCWMLLAIGLSTWLIRQMARQTSPHALANAGVEVGPGGR
jgi:predicted MFS family arabinose efflux permease